MNCFPFQSVDRFIGHPNISLHASAGCKDLEIRKGRIVIIIRIPEDVLEWFVDVRDSDTIVAADWWDYEGYDDTPKHELARSMASDIEAFVTNLLGHEVRIADRAPGFIESRLPRLLHRNGRIFKPRQRLEWLINGAWEEAVPLTPSGLGRS